MSTKEALAGKAITPLDIGRNRLPRAPLRTYQELSLNVLNIPIVGFNAAHEVGALAKQLEIVGQENAVIGHRENIESWIKEYVRCEAVIPINYRINEKGHIVDKSGRRVLEQIDPNEREGAVCDVWEENERFLDKAPVGSVSMLWSPEGCSNIKDPQDKEIDYPDSYFYFFKKDATGLKSVVVRTNLSVIECQKLFYKLRNKYKPYEPIPFLGVDKKTVTSNLVRNGLYLEATEDQSYGFGELVDEIVAMKKDPFEGENSTNAQVCAALEKEDQEEQNALLHQYISDLTNFFAKFPDALQTIVGQKWLEKQMKEALIKIILYSKGESFGSADGRLTNLDRDKALGYMQTFRGCFGVGKGVGITSVTTIGGLRMGMTGNSEGWETGRCVGCGQLTYVLCNFCKACGEAQPA